MSDDTKRNGSNTSSRGNKRNGKASVPRERHRAVSRAVLRQINLNPDLADDMTFADLEDGADIAGSWNS